MGQASVGLEIASRQTDDPVTDEFENAVIFAQFGEVDIDALSV